MGKNKRKGKRKAKKKVETVEKEASGDEIGAVRKRSDQIAQVGENEVEETEEAKRKRAEEVEMFRRLMVKRDQDRIMGIQAMRRHEFDKARVHFENYLVNKFSAIDDAETVQNVLHNLIVCRLQGVSKQENLERCVKDCDILLNRSYSDMSVHLAKINALTRLLDFKGAAKCIREATEEDQKQNLELLHSYMFHLQDKNNDTIHQSIEHKFELPVSKDELKDMYLNLTLPSRQNLFSFTWEQVHEAIDSELGTAMIPENARAGVQEFLHKCLDFNVIPTENRESQLYFLKQELGCLVAQTLWNHFEMPDERPECDVPLEKLCEFFVIAETSNAQNSTMSILSEHGMYFAHEGSEFVSSACLDSISLMTHILSVSNSDENKKLFVNVNQLYDVGFELIHFLSQNTHSDYSCLCDTESDAAKASSEDWDQFAQFRIKWHEKLDLKAIETLTPPKDNDDPKYFENHLETVLGKEKTRELLKVEFDASKPILEKYADIISEISGIDKDTILAELTDEDDFLETYGQTQETDSNDTEKTSNSTENVSENETDKEAEDKEKKYEPIGISLLVQSTQFDLKPSNSADNTYDKQLILDKLKLLEKDVVQFQIDYKKIVFEAAGNKAGDLKEVMSNISFKGLELTKWLRGFVHYMLDRRDLEQEVLDYCGAQNAVEWSAWFENLGLSMSAAQSLLLCLIGRVFMSNVFYTYIAERERLEAEEAGNNVEDVEEVAENGADAGGQGGAQETTESAETETAENTQTTETQERNEEEVEGKPDHLKSPLYGDSSAQESYGLVAPQTAPPVKKNQTALEDIVVPELLANLPRFCPSAGHRLENRQDTLSYISSVNDISQPLMADLSKIKKALLPQEVPDAINNWLETSIVTNLDLPDKIRTFKEKLGVQKLVIPCVNVQLPVQYILKFLGSGYNYHKEGFDHTSYQMVHDDLRVMTLMLDRALKSQETLFHLVYSSADQKVLGFPTRRSMGIPSVVLCQNCDKIFGNLHCQKCSVAHYCSRECQVSKWDSHKHECREWKKLGSRISYYEV